MLLQPVLGLTYAAAYLGIGSGAFDLALEEGARAFADGSRRLDSAVNQRRIAELSTRKRLRLCYMRSRQASTVGN